MRDLDALLERVPGAVTLLEPAGVAAAFDALLAAFPGRARRERVGTSADGRPIDLVSVGHGGRAALLVGVPHPNEPIGTLTALFLARLFCEDPALARAVDLTLHVVPVADPDGLELNAGWLGRPMTFATYAAGFYRPPHHEQVEWSYPVWYRTLRFTRPTPEAAAVMRVMERVRPELFYSLHNAGFGGVYFYASAERRDLFAAWTGLVERLGLPLHRGEPETPYLEAFAPGVYRMFGAAETYEYLARTLGGDPAELIGAGTSGDDWVRSVRADAFSLVCEVPYFTAAAAGDTAGSGCRRRDAIRAGLAAAERIATRVIDAVARLGPALPADRIGRSLRAYADKTPLRLAAERAGLADAAYDREATRAEEADARWGPVFYHALYVGEAMRAAQAAGERGLAAELEREIARLEDELRSAAGLQPVPLRRLVQCQAGAALVALAA